MKRGRRILLSLAGAGLLQVASFGAAWCLADQFVAEGPDTSGALIVGFPWYWSYYVAHALDLPAPGLLREIVILGLPVIVNGAVIFGALSFRDGRRRRALVRVPAHENA